jgi:gas vesicle protein
MNAPLQERRDYGFVIGLLTGTCVGAGLAMWLAPRLASELRERMTGSAKSLGQRASEQYQQASTRVGEVVGELTRKGQGVRDDVADAVARGAHEVARGASEVERHVRRAKSDRVTETMRRSAADRSPSARHAREEDRQAPAPGD